MHGASLWVEMFIITGENTGFGRKYYNLFSELVKDIYILIELSEQGQSWDTLLVLIPTILGTHPYPFA